MIDAFDRPAASAAGDSIKQGTSGAAARADHVHGREAADANLSGTPTTSAVGDSAAVGTSTTGSRSDHRHGREAFATTADLADIAATESAGSAATVPRGDHVHALAGLGAWASFTPSWTSSGTAPAIGNGTISGRYAQFGKTVHFKILLTAGSTTTFGTGVWSLSLPPVGNSANTIEQDIVGRVAPGGQTYQAFGQITQNNTVVSVQSVTSQSDTRVTGVDSTHPASWTATSSNVIVLSGTYELT